jgi:hypothetical protein
MINSKNTFFIKKINKIKKVYGTANPGRQKVTLWEEAGIKTTL